MQLIDDLKKKALYNQVIIKYNSLIKITVCFSKANKNKKALIFLKSVGFDCGSPCQSYDNNEL
ncbi:hypothetical protein BpHYR1_012556 [Brachionus plicatilis]|uniref:Uncharacterized protein n=1 Tax=Brachionus plicatilis TaxID=10195 RepID=A0A3M7PK13_BRAPC|nr:hypothetical protein BpHYR1_012556 [Brachionus plicatilis]